MKILDVPQSGSVAGVTSSRNRYGQYRRTRAVPVNPNTAKQSAVRSVLGALTRAWSGLTPVQQASWVTYAAAHPRRDSLGTVIVLAPNAMFIAFNMPIVLFQGGSVLTTAPAGGSGIALPVPTYTPAYDSSGPPYLTVGYDPDPFAAGVMVAVFAGKPQSAGVSFDKNLRFMGKITAGDTPSPADFSAPFLAAWGAAASGNKIFLRFDTYEVNGPQLDSLSTSIIAT